jgi:O-antigen/teichoic acid export membrane protein
LTISAQQENLLQSAENSRLRTDTLAASVVILMLVTVVQRSVGFGRGILFCRWLSPESLGQWEMAYSFLMLAAPLAVLGVPGSFGRYVEHYRQRGQLRTFLRRTTVWTFTCCLLASGIVLYFAPQFSQLIYGSKDWAPMMTGIAFCLAAIIFHHMLASLFTAMRMIRVVSLMSFANSLLFATLSLGLLWWMPRVSSLLIGYGIASLLTSLGALAWTLSGFKQIEDSPKKLAQFEFWNKLLRFAVFVWISNFLAHLFGIVDRYMIVHYGGFTPAEAMQQVGFYHSSRLVPLLMVSFADLLSSLSLPHLSHDWEAGRRAQVGHRLNFTLKITCLGMLAFGVTVLLLSPLLFHVILQGKYDNGLAVLPWTLAGCSWYGIYAVAHNYLWCAEKTKQATLPLAAGLAVNILLNLLLLPIWGLLGAVLATAASTFFCFVLTLLLSRHYGMPIARGTWVLGLAPAVLGLGTIVATVTLLLLVGVSLGTPLVFDLHERQEIRQLITRTLSKWWPSTARPLPADH